MELVYLWVKKYKNIEEQGFNFSPKFTCHYDENSTELTIDENDDYIENFFGDNINVTAIVGKNGSGKSSVAQVLSIFNTQDFLDRISFFVFFKNKKFYIQKDLFNPLYSIIGNPNNKYEISEGSIPRPELITYFASKESSFLTFYGSSYFKKYDKLDAYYETNTSLMNNLNTEFNEEYNNKIEIFNRRFFDQLKKDSETFIFLNEKYIFTKYYHEIHCYELGVSIRENKIIMNLFDEDKFQSNNTIFVSPTKQKDAKIFLYKYIVLLILDEKKEEITKDFITNLKDDFINNKESVLNKTKEVLNIGDDIYNEKNIQDILNRYECNIKYETLIEKVSNSIKEGLREEKNLLLKKLIKNFDRINVHNGDNREYSYKTLSTGERAYMSQLVTFLFRLQEKNRRSTFIFDEPDIGLHPAWQKKFIKDLMYLKNKYDESNYLHFIFLSHSPFLLSDIPKQNIIFLEKDEDGKCKVVDGLKEKKQTFGANIHTLLSDSFFMEDGLMGEFAKGKINEIIEFHKEVEEENKKEKSNFNILKAEYEKVKTKFWDIQSIIGEDYLKQVIKNHLRDIESLLGYKEARKEEIKRLRAEADRLEKM